MTEESKEPFRLTKNWILSLIALACGLITITAVDPAAVGAFAYHPAATAIAGIALVACFTTAFWAAARVIQSERQVKLQRRLERRARRRAKRAENSDASSGQQVGNAEAKGAGDASQS